MKPTIISVHHDDYGTGILLNIAQRNGLRRVLLDGDRPFIKWEGTRYYLSTSELGVEEAIAA